MTSRLISSVAAVALLASGGLALAQGTGSDKPNGGKEMSTGGGKATGAGESGGAKGAAERGPAAGEKGEKPGAAKAERSEKSGERARDAGGDHDRDRADRGDRDRGDRGDRADRGDRGDRGRDRADRGDRERGGRDDVKVSIRVGGVVPEGRRIAPLRTDLVTRYPQYRGFNMVIVDDQIAIVDPGTRKIVKTVSEGSAGMDHRATDCR